LKIGKYNGRRCACIAGVGVLITVAQRRNGGRRLSWQRGGRGTLAASFGIARRGRHPGVLQRAIAAGLGGLAGRASRKKHGMNLYLKAEEK